MMRNVLALLAVLWSLALAQQYRGLALGTAYPEIGRASCRERVFRAV